MGIKCSLFGHAYGETAVERDREEQGSEVIITIREVETCKRCGETRVVSENKEVTTIETPEEVSTSRGVEEESESAGDEKGGDVQSGPTAETSVGAEIVDADAGKPVDTDGSNDTNVDAGPEGETADDNVSAAPDTGTGSDEEIPPAAEDDGVILDDDEEPERDPGEWPEEAQTGASHHGDGPETADGIERFGDGDSETSGDESESPGGQETTATDVPAESGAATGGVGETSSDAGSDVEGSEAGPIERAEESEVWSEADPDLERDRPGTTVTVPEGQFRCPECEFTTPVASSSLREGDFCPECHQGTLVHESE